MACGAQESLEKGEGIHPAARSVEQGTPRTALGKSGEEICLRWPWRKRVAWRPLRRQEPIDRLPLHVWSGVEGGLPELLVQYGSYGRCPRHIALREVHEGTVRMIHIERATRAARCDVCSDFKSGPAPDPSF